MKKELVFLAMLCASFLAGVSFADTPENKKASVSTTQVKDTIVITITPDQSYKWNGQYPATLKFSVCSDVECVMYTEKIKVQKSATKI